MCQRAHPCSCFWHHSTKCDKELGSIPSAAAWMAATTSGMLAVLSSQLREKTLTLLSDSRWIWARVPSYLYSARKGAPLSCLMASGMPSLIFANMGFNGTPAVSQSVLPSLSLTNGWSFRQQRLYSEAVCRPDGTSPVYCVSK